METETTNLIGSETTTLICDMLLDSYAQIAKDYSLGAVQTVPTKIFAIKEIQSLEPCKICDAQNIYGHFVKTYNNKLAKVGWTVKDDSIIPGEILEKKATQVKLDLLKYS